MTEQPQKGWITKLPSLLVAYYQTRLDYVEYDKPLKEEFKKAQQDIVAFIANEKEESRQQMLRDLSDSFAEKHYAVSVSDIETYAKSLGIDLKE